MHFSSFTAVAVLVVAAVAAPSNIQRHVLHEKRETARSSWIKRDRLRPDVKLPMRIGLVQSNLDQGHDLLMDV
jgi:tripeptidyl-peptidase-1